MIDPDSVKQLRERQLRAAKAVKHGHPSNCSCEDCCVRRAIVSFPEWPRCKSQFFVSEGYERNARIRRELIAEGKLDPSWAL